MERTQTVGKRTLDQKTLDDIIRRIVEVAHPEKIILFGSAARGEMGPNSDVDLLVIKSGAHRLDLTGQIYMNMHGAGEAVDIIVGGHARGRRTVWQQPRSGNCPRSSGR
jgi:predicted nucleotidyltransferase